MNLINITRRCVVVVSLAMVPALHAAPVAGAEKPGYVLISAPLSLDAKTTVPGHKLESGKYSIRIIDHLKDRYILRIDDEEGKPVATFIGLHNPEFAPFVALHHQGPIFWTAGPKSAASIRGFSFADGNTLEFVYPKAEAVALAKLNTYSVPAIDPESEGRKPDPKLTPEDREVVTLWMLRATRVGPKEETPAIEAKRFVAPVEPDPVAASQIAQNEPPRDLPIPQRASSAQASIDEPAGRVSKVRTKPVATSLPQTASDLPLLMLFTLGTFLAAGSLRLRRLRA